MQTIRSIPSLPSHSVIDGIGMRAAYPAAQHTLSGTSHFVGRDDAVVVAMASAILLGAVDRTRSQQFMAERRAVRNPLRRHHMTF